MWKVSDKTVPPISDVTMVTSDENRRVKQTYRITQAYRSNAQRSNLAPLLTVILLDPSLLCSVGFWFLCVCDRERLGTRGVGNPSLVALLRDACGVG